MSNLETEHAPLDPDARQALQDAKLKEEWRKTRREARNAGYSVWLQTLSSIASAATVIIAVVSLRCSSVAQTRQQEEARFGDALKAVVDRNAYPDVSGPLAILSEFSSDSARRRRFVPVLVQQLLTANAAGIEQVREVLLRNPDTSLIASLARQNRMLLRLMKSETIDESAFRLQLGDSRSSIVAFESDSGAKLDRLLRTNIEVLREAMGRVRVLRGLDLSHTALSRPTLVVSFGDSVFPVRPPVLGEDGLLRGVKFDGVSLKGASLLGMRFDRDTFVNSNLDSVLVGGARLDSVVFAGGNSLRRITPQFYLARLPDAASRGTTAFRLASATTCLNCATRDSIDIDLSALTGLIFTEESFLAEHVPRASDFAGGSTIKENRELVRLFDSTYTRLDTTTRAVVASMSARGVDRDLITFRAQQRNGPFQFRIVLDSMSLDDFHDNEALIRSVRLIPTRPPSTNAVAAKP